MPPSTQFHIKDFIPVFPTHMDVPVRIDAIQLSFPRALVSRSRTQAFFQGHPNFSWHWWRYYSQLVIHGELLHHQPDVAAFLRTLVALMDSQNLLAHETLTQAALDATLDYEILFATEISISRVELTFDLRPAQIILSDPLRLKLLTDSHYSSDFIPGRRKPILVLYDLHRKYVEKNQTPATFLAILQRPWRLEFCLRCYNCRFLNLSSLAGNVAEIMNRFSGFLGSTWQSFPDFHETFQLENLLPEQEILDLITGYQFDDRSHGLVRSTDWRKQVFQEINDRFEAIRQGLKNLFG